MKARKKEDQISLIIDKLILIFIAPLIISKILGDGIISVTKFLWQVINKAYKIIILLFNFIINLISQIGKTSFTVLYNVFKRKKKTSIKKRGVIYSKKRFFSFSPPKLPKIKISFLPAFFYQRHWLTSYKLLLVKIKFLFLGLFLAGLIAIFYYASFIVSSLPNPGNLQRRDIPTTTKIYDRNNTLLYEIYAE